MNKKCKLCGKTFNNSNYEMFGTGCFKKVCKELDIEIPKKIKAKDREKYLCSTVAKRLDKKGLTNIQKQYLTELYLTTIYIDKIQYINLDELKRKIEKQMENLNFLTGLLLPNKDLTMILYSIYSAYNATETFKNNLTEIEQMDTESDNSEEEKQNIKKDKKTIQYFQYIFNINKILDPKIYALNYYKQYIIWEAVINSGLLVNFKLSSKLLRHALSEVGEEPQMYNITDKKIIEDMKEDKDLKTKLKEIIDEHEDEKYFKTNQEVKKQIITFESNADYKYSLHNANLIVEGNKNKDNYWDLNVEILDRYDFTDFVFPNEYDDKYKEIRNDEENNSTNKIISSIKNGVGYTLNNMALVSVQYGVLKEYDVKIEFSIDNFEK